MNGVTNITQFIFQNAFVHMYFMFTRTMETLHKVNSTVLVFAYWFVHILPTFSTSSLLMSKERKGRELWAVLSFPSVSSFQHQWWDNMGRNTDETGSDRVSWSPLSRLKQGSPWLEQMPSLIGLSLRDGQSALLAKPPHIVPPPEFCAQGVSQTWCVNEGHAGWARSLSSCACSIAIL